MNLLKGRLKHQTPKNREDGISGKLRHRSLFGVVGHAHTSTSCMIPELCSSEIHTDL